MGAHHRPDREADRRRRPLNRADTARPRVAAYNPRVLAAGTRLGPHEILGPIGAGGMGGVYRARDPKLQRDVAIKVLPASVLSRADALARFEREARAVAALSHPNILAIHDFGDAGGMPYAVTELLEGETLREALARGPLPVRRALDYAAQIARGLAAAHDKGIVHRDLKPENVFVTKDERVKILDFGLARHDVAPAAGTFAPTLLSPTEPGVILGTVGYMAPEQVRGATADSRADLFAFGAILYEMITGERAFGGETGAEAMTAILREEPAPSALGRAMPPAVDRIVRHCLEKKPEARFQSAHDLGFALDAVAGASSSTVAVAASADLPRPAPRRKWTAAIAVAAAVALAAAAFAIGRRTSSASSPLPTFRQLTFNRGLVPMARFAPDGHTVIYSAAWNGAAPRLFLTRLDGAGATPLSLPGAVLYSVSRTGEIAMGLSDVPGSVLQTVPRTLAEAPMLSTSVRPLLERVTFADWSPVDGSLAVVRVSGSHQRLEFPLGHLLFETDGDIGYPRVSPGGDRVAFAEWPVKDDDRGSIAIVGTDGVKHTISRDWEAIRGLAWAADGREVWYTAANSGTRYELWGSTPGGRERAILRIPGGLILYDVASDGRLLLCRFDRTSQVNVWQAGEQAERDGSWLDFSTVRDISADGRRLLLTYSGEGSGISYDVFVRTIDQEAIRIGAGQAQQFSPDGKSALAIVHGPPTQLVVLPIGAGEPRTIATGAVTPIAARWLAGGRRLLVAGTEPSHGLRLYVTDESGTPPRPISPEGITFGPMALAVSNDGTTAIARSREGAMTLYPTLQGAPSPANGFKDGEMPIGWTVNGWVLVPEGAPPRRLVRVDPRSGARELVAAIRPSDPALLGPQAVVATPDGRSYAATYDRRQVTLYLVEGVK